MRKQFRKTPIVAARDDFDEEYNLDEVHDIMEWPWDYDTPEEMEYALKDNGYGVAHPCTLRAACEMLYEFCPDLDDALHQIDIEFGNCTGVFPLCRYDWRTQQEIYEQWFSEAHSDEIDDPGSFF